ncbi:hypothetical protein KY314_00815 [Candidatus Woesearchaeota archaeon]|nr:hypothetical protein [Candidatus Woesearchaeota archaeon]
MLSGLFFSLAVINLIFVSACIYKKKKNLAITLAIVEIILIYFGLTL